MTFEKFGANVQHRIKGDVEYATRKSKLSRHN